MKIQDSSVLLSEGPAELLERSLAEYAALLRGTGDLQAAHLQAVDYALRHTVVRLLARAAGEEELEAAYEELRRLVPVEREGELATWVPRWRAFADLLEARLAALSTRDVEGARRLAHAATILGLVEEEPGLTQAEIGKRLGLKPANLSRILGVLEAHELIERRSLGRERRVHPGRLAGAPPETPAEPPAPVEDELPRGMAFLFKAA